MAPCTMNGHIHPIARSDAAIFVGVCVCSVCVCVCVCSVCVCVCARVCGTSRYCGYRRVHSAFQDLQWSLHPHPDDTHDLVTHMPKHCTQQVVTDEGEDGKVPKWREEQIAAMKEEKASASTWPHTKPCLCCSVASLCSTHVCHRGN
jgi:hypothetical protein